MFNKPVWTYLGMALAAAAMILGVIKPDWAPIVWTVAGVLGAGSVAALRTMIDAKGYKTYAIAIVFVGSSVAMLFGAITPDTFQAIIIVFAPITGITMQQALAKSSSSVPTARSGT